MDRGAPRGLATVAAVPPADAADEPDPAPTGGADALDALVTYDDFRDAARRRLTPAAYDYFASGALTEWTLRENERAFRRWRFHKRVLVDVSTIDTGTTVLGERVPFPVLVAPTAFHRLADPDGEVATARAVRAAGTVMVASTMATASLEDIAGVGVDRWFQLYVQKDRGFTRELVARAVAAGYRAIVLTVDTPFIGIRYTELRNRFQLPDGITLGNFGEGLGAAAGGPDGAGSSGLRAFSEQFDQTLDWSDLAWLCGECAAAGLPVVAKGILTGVDARRAVAAGVAGVVVSNHGGRQLDGDPATLDALPEVVDEVGGDTEVLLDGGVRTGPDVVKAIALGARAVLIGRPVLWGLAAGGQAGVERVLALLRDEVADTLRQAGVPRLADVGPDLVRPSAGPQPASGSFP
jgi:isopentenyl diphosphate isomerase/L-lactate dehydrogenase-like FMN-dependent dehydrogenase